VGVRIGTLLGLKSCTARGPLGLGLNSLPLSATELGTPSTGFQRSVIAAVAECGILEVCILFF